MSVMSSAKKKIEEFKAASAAERKEEMKMGREHSASLTIAAQEAEKRRFHAEAMRASAEAAHKDWQVSQQSFDCLMYKIKSDLGVKSEWLLKRFEDGLLGFAPPEEKK